METFFSLREDLEKGASGGTDSLKPVSISLPRL
jgi:hypothetical protein